jgi:hypothetical protein
MDSNAISTVAVQIELSPGQNLGCENPGPCSQDEELALSFFAGADDELCLCLDK